MPSKSNPAGQRILLLGDVEILVRNPVTPCGFLLAEQQNALAKRVLLKETCSNGQRLCCFCIIFKQL
jgi:hypothetical protein